MARIPAQIQADIVKAQAAVNTATAANVQAQATLVSAQAAATLAATNLKNAQAALDGFKAELAGLPPQFTPSPNGTTITPLTGSITDKLGQVWTIGKDGKEYRNTVAVPSSGGVLKMVVDGDGLKQWNGKDWWSQPLTWPAGGDGAGVVVLPPGGVVVVPPVVVPPVVVPPVASGKAPITGASKVLFLDNFKDLSNWTHTFPGKSPADKFAYAYNRSEQRNGENMDKSFAGNPDGYPPMKGMEDPVKLVTGGVQLSAYRNPKAGSPDFYIPPQLPTAGDFIGSWICSKQQFGPGCEMQIGMTLPPFMNGQQIGQWAAHWLINVDNWEEIDISDGMWGGPLYPGRWWFAGGSSGGSQPTDGVVKEGYNTLHFVWENNRLRAGWNGKISKDYAGGSNKSKYLILQNLAGGWDLNNQNTKMAARTSHVVNSVTVWTL